MVLLPSLTVFLIPADYHDAVRLIAVRPPLVRFTNGLLQLTQAGLYIRECGFQRTNSVPEVSALLCRGDGGNET